MSSTLSRQYGVSGRKVQASKARLAPGLTCRQVDLSAERMSTTGVAAKVQNATVKTTCRTPAVQALSSPEAETYGIGSGIVEGLGIKNLLEQLDEEVELEIGSDSSSGIAISSRLGQGRLKHVEIKYLFMQNHVKRREIKIDKVDAKVNDADWMTMCNDVATLE